jgi:hypothetical protein
MQEPEIFGKSKKKLSTFASAAWSSGIVYPWGAFLKCFFLRLHKKLAPTSRIGIGIGIAYSYNAYFSIGTHCSVGAKLATTGVLKNWPLPPRRLELWIVRSNPARV